MSSQIVVAVIGVAFAAFGIPGACILVFRAIRNPLREQLVAMTKDRDFYRDKTERLDAELRQRRQR